MIKLISLALFQYVNDNDNTVTKIMLQLILIYLNMLRNDLWQNARVLQYKN